MNTRTYKIKGKSGGTPAKISFGDDNKGSFSATDVIVKSDASETKPKPRSGRIVYGQLQ
jgi:hypothetical protein